LNIPQNQTIGAKGSSDSLEFLQFVTSTSTKTQHQKMKSKGLETPNLSKCLQFNQIMYSRKFKMFTNENISLPKNHMELQNTIILPVVINKTTVALSNLISLKCSWIDQWNLF
jgi:hypothetical protein